MNNQTIGEIDTPLELPDWLSAGDLPLPSTTLSVANAKSNRELIYIKFANAFEGILDRVASGYSLKKALEEDFRQFEAGMFIQWMKKTGDLYSRYVSAKEMRSELWVSDLIDIADADDSMEDVQRSRLKIDTRKWIIASDNRKTYGDTKTIDIGGQISILGALAAANSRTIDLIDDITDVGDNRLSYDGDSHGK